MYHFAIAKAAVGVLLQGDDDGVEDLLHPRDLDVLLAANKVLVDCFEPAWVVMAVGDDVDVDGVVPPVMVGPSSSDVDESVVPDCRCIVLDICTMCTGVQQ